VSAADTHRVIDAVWRIESAKLIAGLARIVRDVGTAEELAQDALVAALEQWPHSGVPDNPGAWLMGTAKHRAIDVLRRRSLLERKHEELGRELNQQTGLNPRSLERLGSRDRHGDQQRLGDRGIGDLVRTGGRPAGDQVAPGDVGPGGEAVAEAGQVQPGCQEAGGLRALTGGSDNKHPSTLHCRSPPGGMRKMTNLCGKTL